MSSTVNFVEEEGQESNVTLVFIQNTSTVEQREMYLLAYTGLMLLCLIFTVCRSFGFYGMCLRISINLHDMLLRGVTRANMIFFRNNPTGRILNRFAKDINNLDVLLPNTVIDVFDVNLIEFRRSKNRS